MRRVEPIFGDNDTSSNNGSADNVCQGYPECCVCAKGKSGLDAALSKSQPQLNARLSRQIQRMRCWSFASQTLWSYIDPKVRYCWPWARNWNTACSWKNHLRTCIIKRYIGPAAAFLSILPTRMPKNPYPYKPLNATPEINLDMMDNPYVETYFSLYHPELLPGCHIRNARPCHNQSLATVAISKSEDTSHVHD